jgi:hypothetical protein
MEVYSIERDGKIEKQKQQHRGHPSCTVTGASTASQSTQVLVAEHVVSNHRSNNVNNTTNRLDFMGRKSSGGRKRSKRCFYIFTAVTLFLFVICFVFMSIVTARLLFNSYFDHMNMGQSGGGNVSGTAAHHTLNTNRKLGDQDTIIDSNVVNFNAYEKNFLKFILTNITSSLNKTSGGGNKANSNLIRGSSKSGNSPAALDNTNVHTIQADDPYFERNLFSWLKNTFKMAFLGKYESDTAKAVSTSTVSTKFNNNFHGDPKFDINLVPFNKKANGLTGSFFPHITCESLTVVLALGQTRSSRVLVFKSCFQIFFGCLMSDSN